MELGEPETRSACAAIARFEDSDATPDAYLLIHNHDGRSQHFRITVQESLDALVASGRVGSADLWDRQRLLKEAFNATLLQLMELVPRASLALAPTAAKLGDTILTHRCELDEKAESFFIEQEFDLEDCQIVTEGEPEADESL